MSTPELSVSTTLPEERWAVVELMGYASAAGRVTSVTEYGATLMRLDIPLSDGSFATQDIGGSAIYRIRYVTEEVARAAAARMADPRPLSPASFKPALPPRTLEDADEPL